VATRRNFTQEYKDQAVSLVLDSGRSIAEVARSIGIHEMTLGKWVKKARESGRVPDKDLSEPERAELERLRKEVATLKMERDFAKKLQPGSRRNSREVRGDRGLGHREAVLGHVHVRPARRVPAGLLPVAGRGPVPAVTHRRRTHLPDPRHPRRAARTPRRAPSLGRTRRPRGPGRPQAGVAADARRRPAGTSPTSRETHHRRRSATHRRPGPDRAGLHRRGARHALVWRHHLRRDRRRLGLYRHRDRSALAHGGGLRRGRSPAHQRLPPPCSPAAHRAG
jgi:transposase